MKSDATQYRPADDSLLVGDSTRARTLLAWKPIVNLEQVIQEMVESDLSLEQSKNV